MRSVQLVKMMEAAAKAEIRHRSRVLEASMRRRCLKAKEEEEEANSVGTACDQCGAVPSTDASASEPSLAVRSLPSPPPSPPESSPEKPFVRLIEESDGERTDNERNSVTSHDCCGFEGLLHPVGYVTTAVITLNISCMLAPYKGMSAQYAQTLSHISLACTVYFVCECALKLVVFGHGNPLHGWIEYWSTRSDHNWNRLDFSVIAIDIGSMLLEGMLAKIGGGHTSTAALRILRVFRALRILRAFKLSAVWQPLNNVLLSMFEVVKPVASLGLLILLFTLIFGLLGKELLGGRGLNKLSRWHYDDPVPALLTPMAIFSANWAEALYDANAAAESGLVSRQTSGLLVVATLLVGHFVLVNLFVAVLVERFVEDETSRRREATRRKKEFEEEQQRRAGRVLDRWSARTKTIAARIRSIARTSPSPSSFRRKLHVDTEIPPSEVDVQTTPAKQLGESFNSSSAEILTEEADNELKGVTCGCMGPESLTRRLARTILENEAWEMLVLSLIFVSCICLSYDNPRLEPGSEIAANLAIANVVLTLLFTLEAALKIAVHGFLLADGAYLRKTWNQLDFFILLTSLPTILPGAAGGSSVVRLLRVLRPLRLIARVPGMSVIFRFFLESIVDLANVAGVNLFFVLCFSAIGMQLFQEVDFPQPQISFDSFMPTALLLFVMATGDAWTNLMWVVMDAPTVPGGPPVRNDSSPASIYFITWLYLGKNVMINLFVASVVNNFVRIKDEEHTGFDESSGALLTKGQRQWQITLQAVREHKRQHPGPRAEPPELGSARRWVHDVITSRGFEVFMAVVIVLNVLVMSLSYYRIEDDALWFALYSKLMWLFTRLYYIECVLKMAGLGLAGYFGDGWNRFEFGLVAISLIEDFVEDAEEIIPIPPMLLRVLRITRVLRLVRLIKDLKGLRDVIMTLFLSFPSFLNVGSLLCLIIFIYAVLGVQLFSLLVPGTALGGDRTFATLSGSAELLLQCLTADGWSLLLLDALASPEDGRCGLGDAGISDCGTPAAYLYFISFVMLGKFILSNLIVAVILQNFSSLGDLNPELASKDDIDVYNEAWNKVDEEGSGYIWSTALPELLMQLERPLRPVGVDPNDAAFTRRLVKALVARGHLPQRLVKHGYLEYRFVLDTLIRFSFEAYNRAHFDDHIAEPPAEHSLWSRFKRRARKGGADEHRLGVGSHAQQLRALTAWLQSALLRIEQLEAEVSAANLKVDTVMDVVSDGTRVGHTEPRTASAGGAGGRAVASAFTPVLNAVRQEAERTQRRGRKKQEGLVVHDESFLSVVETASVAAASAEMERHSPGNKPILGDSKARAVLERLARDEVLPQKVLEDAKAGDAKAEAMITAALSMLGAQPAPAPSLLSSSLLAAERTQRTKPKLQIRLGESFKRAARGGDQDESTRQLSSPARAHRVLDA